jgi:putative SOS response-associated peptidase YedK
MCGRFRQTRSQKQLEDAFNGRFDGEEPHEGAAAEVAPHYNIAPSQTIVTVRQAPSQRMRRLSFMRWGLIPHWAKELKIGYKNINARAETAATTPSFRDAFRSQRCLIPADGFYEWVRHEVACVTVRRVLPDRTCHPIGSTLRGMAFRKRIV